MNTGLEKVQQLEKLVQQYDPRNSGADSILTQATSVLDQIATSLREANARNVLGNSNLPATLVALLNTNANSGAYNALVAQIGRVAANLVADNDPNRERLNKEGFADAVIKCLKSQATLPLASVRPLAASLLNLTNDHIASSETLLNRNAIVVLLQTANRLYTPGDWSGEEQEARATTAEWLWTVVNNVIGEKSQLSFSLTASDVALFVPPLGAAKPQDQPPTGIEDLEDIAEEALGHDASILQHATNVLERMGKVDKIDPTVFEDAATVQALFDFVENGAVPSWLDISGWEVEEELIEKGLGIAKAAIARTIVEVLSHVPEPSDSVWGHIRRWLAAEDRPDLVSCALLAYGNYARSDKTSLALVAQPGFVDGLVKLLKPSAPPLLQHSLVGLLRNLSIPEANKAALGKAGVIQSVVDMQPWTRERDLLGSIQGGAVGIVKNLVRNPTNAITFLTTPTGLADLLGLIRRTNDAAIEMEAARVLAAATRSLATVRSNSDAPAPAGLDAAWAAIKGSEVVACLVRMFIAGTQHPVLVNEAIVALTLQATFGNAEAVAQALLETHQTAKAPEGQGSRQGPSPTIIGADDATAQALASADVDGGAEPQEVGSTTGANVLAGILADTQAGPGPQIQSNAVILLGQLANGKEAGAEVKKVVREEVAVARSEGKEVAVGLDKFLG